MNYSTHADPFANVGEVCFRAVKYYLQKIDPQYKDHRFEIREREIQSICFSKLLLEGFYVRAEQRYRARSLSRCDLLLEDEKTSHKAYVEIEWSAKWTDGFNKATFSDWGKLHDRVPIGSTPIFLALNISNKWKNFSKRTRKYNDAGQLPLSSRCVKQTALGRYWDRNGPLLRKYGHTEFRVWSFPTADPDKEYNAHFLSWIGNGATAISKRRLSQSHRAYA